MLADAPRPDWLERHRDALAQAEADALSAQARLRELVLERQNFALADAMPDGVDCEHFRTCGEPHGTTN